MDDEIRALLTCDAKVLAIYVLHMLITYDLCYFRFSVVVHSVVSRDRKSVV